MSSEQVGAARLSAQLREFETHITAQEYEQSLCLVNYLNHEFKSVKIALSQYLQDLSGRQVI